MCVAVLGREWDDCSLIDLFLILDGPDWFVGALQGWLGEGVTSALLPSPMGGCGIGFHPNSVVNV